MNGKLEGLENDDRFLVEMGFTSVEIAKVRAIQSRERGRAVPHYNIIERTVRNHANSCPAGKSFLWRNWIVENLMGEHRASNEVNRQKRFRAAHAGKGDPNVEELHPVEE